MDYRIAGVETDCKFSQSLGGWEFPPEAYENQHLCLVVWASDELSRWEAGLIRVHDDLLSRSANRDGKRRLTQAGKSRIRWLYVSPRLPENLLLQIDDDVRERIFNPRPGRESSGQERINMLFRLVQRRLVNRASVLTVAQQKNSLKRVRDARLPQHLGGEGILVLGHQGDDPLVAEALGLPRPPSGSFVSVRVFPAEPDFDGPVALIAGRCWRVARDDDPVVEAPRLRGGNA
jgi:hypothetical protein